MAARVPARTRTIFSVITSFARTREEQRQATERAERQARRDAETRARIAEEQQRVRDGRSPRPDLLVPDNSHYGNPDGYNAILRGETFNRYRDAEIEARVTGVYNAPPLPQDLSALDKLLFPGGNLDRTVAVMFAFGAGRSTLSPPTGTGSTQQNVGSNTQPRPFRTLIQDAQARPGNWRVVRTETVPSTNLRNRGGTSMQELLRNIETGEEIVRHTLFRADGRVFEAPHFREYWNE